MGVADNAFQVIIIDTCGKLALTVMYRSVWEVLVESQKLPMVASAGLEKTVEERKALPDALMSRDAF